MAEWWLLQKDKQQTGKISLLSLHFGNGVCYIEMYNVNA